MSLSLQITTYASGWIAAAAGKDEQPDTGTDMPLEEQLCAYVPISRIAPPSWLMHSTGPLSSYSCKNIFMQRRAGYRESCTGNQCTR
ncbi:hypothetical protein M440DRAFT_1397802 [Trichoderma longibrachiatum ATCC 18648]|uniref:Uncharacterized protein n=1 Tax=Trichoderma longibrachiatum ATCC 18648 TaxID=983965 RepID=A0A2T4CFZ2_TRILO|nr:hypothetical protein M440DRAFT_1397802 [Trichoderma longibrachiatum ATCC 18648]